MIAPVPVLMAKIECVSPLSIAHVRLLESPVASTSTTAASSAAPSDNVAEVSVTATTTLVIVIAKVRSAVLELASVARTITEQELELLPHPGLS